MKHNTIKKKRISRDCWDLDYAFVKWLKERLPVYLKEAGEIVDLEYHKFTYNGEEYTQKALIEKMISLLNSLEGYTDWDQIYHDRVNEVLDIWKLIFFAMWW